MSWLGKEIQGERHNEFNEYEVFNVLIVLMHICNECGKSKHTQSVEVEVCRYI